MDDTRPVDGLSPSSLDTWENCPARFHYEKVRQLPQPPPGEPALVGTAVHRVIELLMYLPPSERTIEACVGFARTAVAELADDLKALGPFDEGTFKRKVWAGVTGYFAIEDPTQVQAAGTERKVSATVGGDSALVGGVPLRGFIDRLSWNGDGLVVDDFKNGKAPAPRYRPWKYRQLRIYALILRELGTPAVAGRLIYTTARQILSVPFTDGDLDETLVDAREAWDGIARMTASGEWPARTGPLCAWCPFLADCADGQAEVRSLSAAGRVRPDAPGAKWIMDNR